MGIIIAVTGGRKPTVTQQFIDVSLDLIARQEGGIDLLIHGNAKGVDRMCAGWARSRGVHVASVDALWDTLGSRAGPVRNAAMLRLKPDLVVAFPGRGGTANMVMQTLSNKIRLIKAG